jgi:hypothetical protein
MTTHTVTPMAVFISNKLPLNTTWHTSPSQQRSFLLLPRTIPHHVSTLPAVEAMASIAARTPAEPSARAAGVVIFLVVTVVTATALLAAAMTGTPHLAAARTLLTAASMSLQLLLSEEQSWRAYSSFGFSSSVM